MKTIVISGAHSGIGKTALAQEVLRGLPSSLFWSAMKVTVKRKSRCPRNKSCGVCGDIKSGFDIITDKKRITKRGTDTCRLKRAGAKKVIWLRTTLKSLKKGLKKAFSLLRESEGVVIEGTSVLKFMRPDITIFLKGRTSKIKASAKDVLKKADIVIDVNR